MDDRWIEDRFKETERRLDRVESDLADVNSVRQAVARIEENQRQTQARLDRFREDTRDDFAAVHSDIKTVSRATIALLTALLAAMVGAIIVLLIAL